jgi:hypothetical protein
MAATTNLDEVGVQSIAVPDWAAGIITSAPPTEIPNNAAQDILNFELDDNGNLATRSGLTELTSDVFPSRITSLHYFTAESGEIGILFTTGATVQIIETGGSGLTDLTGALTLPTDTFWQWKTFDNIAIGCNKATTGDNPVKVTASSVASALGGSPPKAKYIEVWNSRVWLVSATEPNQVWGSALGDPEDWATGAGAADALTLDVDPADGDLITGLFATREALYVFKRKRIFKVVSIDPAEAPTVAQNLKVVIHAQTIGCVSPYSIFPILNDVVFLSEQGLASLTLAAQTEDFRTALYSRKVAEIARTPKITEEIPCFLFDTAPQFWISVPATISLTGAGQVYVMDYLNLDQGIDAVRWVRFDGLAAGTAFTAFTSASVKTYVIGAENADGDHMLYTYTPKAVGPYSDNGAAYTKQLKTKAFTADLPLIRKWWRKWGFAFDLQSNDAAVAVQYFLDSNVAKGGSFSTALIGAGAGALWDEALWDEAEWDTAIFVPFDIVRRLLSNDSGQRGQNITFLVTNAQVDDGLIIKDFMLWYSLLNERKVSDV